MTIGLPPKAAAATRLVLVRHGEPDETVHGRCYGARLDPGLSPLGREQMRSAWRLLDGLTPGAIYSSPSRRAVESTALRVCPGPAAIVDADLREIDFGEFEGLAFAEIAARYPDAYEAWMARPTGVTFPGGETFLAMAARVGAAIDRIRRRHRTDTVVIVSHSGVNRTVLAAALGLDATRIFGLAQGYACVNVIDYIGSEAVICLVNAMCDPC
jgi:broad specificity phosphatase PhoE